MVVPAALVYEIENAPSAVSTNAEYPEIQLAVQLGSAPPPLPEQVVTPLSTMVASRV